MKITKELRARAEKFAQKRYNKKIQFETINLDQNSTYVVVTGIFERCKNEVEFEVPKSIWINPKLLDMSEGEVKCQLALGTLSGKELETIFLGLDKNTSQDVIDLVYEKLFILNIDLDGEDKYLNFNEDTEKKLWTHLNLSTDMITYCLQQTLDADDADNVFSNDFEYFLKSLKKYRKDYHPPYTLLEKAVFVLGNLFKDMSTLKRLTAHSEFVQGKFMENWKQFKVTMFKKEFDNNIQKLTNDVKELSQIKSTNQLIDSFYAHYYDN